ncbi:formylglycine-generating enzyme required for sulfatase activity [Curtobacterium sp. PhB25]|uniref:formylglycine-generating enzyme family protein n=1 Tax=unclassified Curtobacterium TaxID=257496 RepID=UPI001046F0F5|nr:MULTISPECIES: formylglycine-generating enzyme family protein [unclassified Curtobacterium]TCU85795.1 formylglycine-generating enzyme required for sulfatase activity [Curtobacterium sp. PhB191]TDW53270.1 formylglycine-generating enzyme required for sulfatase activity [Curtobacterium sp. PhB42]TDW57960.1 formylglycine-generating enzyme required for sulfatase activity [Curtobacterium sp. PhB190]TDW74281.1 formylglycine-generating enzyme required for sulfatase activity [Curtobacterium sp. PhB25]
MLTLLEAVDVAGGAFLMGSDRYYPDEGPVHERTVAAFRIAAHPVTNAEFAAFVAATGWTTEAERALDPVQYPDLAPADRAPGSLVFAPTTGPVDLGDWRAWWTWCPGADWRHPAGPTSSVDGREEHPVVQVSHGDASAYAAWVGGRLPSEVEWEYAARAGGDPSWPFAWGREAHPGGRTMANTWHGAFPYRNTGARGWTGTSPVGSFPANALGLADMIGNVWEWTDSRYTERHDPSTTPTPPAEARATESSAHCGCGPTDTHHDAAPATPSTVTRVLKGGSHLCAPEYCLRYRPAARSPQTSDSAATHIGFRVVWDG